MKLLLIALLLIAPVRIVGQSIVAVPAAAEVNQVVRIVAPSAASGTWSLSGGEWCLYRNCFWRSPDDMPFGFGAGENPLWRATAAGSYTITLTTPEGSASSVTITVTEP